MEEQWGSCQQDIREEDGLLMVHLVELVESDD
jgi:hypothetical protein